MHSFLSTHGRTCDVSLIRWYVFVCVVCSPNFWDISTRKQSMQNRDPVLHGTTRSFNRSHNIVSPSLLPSLISIPLIITTVYCSLFCVIASFRMQSIRTDRMPFRLCSSVRSYIGLRTPRVLHPSKQPCIIASVLFVAGIVRVADGGSIVAFVCLIGLCFVDALRENTFKNPSLPSALLFVAFEASFVIIARRAVSGEFPEEFY